MRSSDAEYPGIAYLSTVLATSELIHAQDYDRLLVSLGERAPHARTAQAPAGTAKEKLLDAAEKEMYSIDVVYPEFLRRIKLEGLDDAVAMVGYAWESHRQHRDIINKVRRWTPGHFEAVARRIDKCLFDEQLTHRSVRRYTLPWRGRRWPGLNLAWRRLPSVSGGAGLRTRCPRGPRCRRVPLRAPPAP